MQLLLNVLWMALGGIAIFLIYMVAGLVLCLTIIGIPWGIQCFKLAILALFPFGSESMHKQDANNDAALHFLANVIWLIFGGLPLVIVHFALGLVLSLSIIFLPFGLQHFKMMRLSFTPFGRTIYDF
jgi:uncharacterized membrane protein YccF (DUF307 family)